METKINSNLDSEKNKKGVNLSTGEAAASAAGIAGVAGAAAAGIATGSFGPDDNPDRGTSGGDTTGGGTSGGGIASNQNEEINTDNQNGAQEPEDPTDVPFTDSDNIDVVEPIDDVQDPIAEVNVDEIVDEILGIEDVDPSDTDVLAEVVDYEDVGIIYTEDGEEIPADLLAMQENISTEGDVYSDEIDLDDGEQIALVDVDSDETFPETTDQTDESFDTMDFSNDFVG